MDNQKEEMDKITLDTALGWHTWMIVWADEPQRKISVEMTYDDLVRIVDLMKEHGHDAELIERQKYKLTQFEYDLLRTNDQNHNRTLESYATYRNMRKLGYFKDIDFSLTIKDVLSNYEIERRIK